MAINTTVSIAPELAQLLDISLAKGASDILISVGAAPTIRVHGKLEPLTQELGPVTVELAQKMILSMLTQSQTAKLEENRDLDLSYVYGGDKGRYRVNVYYQKGTIAAALRYIPTQIPKLQDLGLPVILERFARASTGLVLLTGPSGHGKTTTLSAIIDMINATRAEHIVTVEDPIEFIHSNKMSIIDQREVNRDALDFPSALRAVLREDPNVILIGEMRDQETTEAALTLAETGHLVFATLHTNDAAQTADRIINIFPPFQQEQIKTVLSAALLGVVSQRLIPKADGTGRAPAVEIMVSTPAVRNLIREGKTHLLPNTIATSTEEGMISMDRALAELVKRGEITYENAEMWSQDPKNLAKLIY